MRLDDAALQKLLGPLADPSSDPQVRLLLADGPDRLAVDRRDRRQEIPGSLPGEALDQLARMLGEGKQGVFERTLEDGSRLLLVTREAGIARPQLVIRPPLRAPRLAELVDSDLVPTLADRLLRGLIQGRRGVLVATLPGGDDGGLLAALAAEVPGDERLLWITDAMRAESLPPDTALSWNLAGDPASGLEVAGRLHADRLALPGLDAGSAARYLELATAAPGSLTSLAAGNAAAAILALEGLALRGGLEVAAVRALIPAAVDVVLVIGRLVDGRRCLTQIAELVPDAGRPRLRDLMITTLAADRDAALPVLVPTGRVPAILPALAPFGVEISHGYFDPAQHGLAAPEPRDPDPIPSPDARIPEFAAAPPLPPVAPAPAMTVPTGMGSSVLPPLPAALPAGPPLLYSDQDDPGWEVDALAQSSGAEEQPAVPAGDPGEGGLTGLGPQSGLQPAGDTGAFATMLRERQDASSGASASDPRHVPQPPPMHPQAFGLHLEPPPETAPIPEIDGVPETEPGEKPAADGAPKDEDQS